MQPKLREISSNSCMLLMARDENLPCSNRYKKSYITVAFIIPNLVFMPRYKCDCALTAGEWNCYLFFTQNIQIMSNKIMICNCIRTPLLLSIALFTKLSFFLGLTKEFATVLPNSFHRSKAASLPVYNSRYKWCSTKHVYIIPVLCEIVRFKLSKRGAEPTMTLSMQYKAIGSICLDVNNTV